MPRRRRRTAVCEIAGHRDDQCGVTRPGLPTRRTEWLQELRGPPSPEVVSLSFGLAPGWLATRSSPRRRIRPQASEGCPSTHLVRSGHSPWLACHERAWRLTSQDARRVEWRRGSDSDSVRLSRICNLKKPRYRDCRRCQGCRRALPAIARPPPRPASAADRCRPPLLRAIAALYPGDRCRSRPRARCKPGSPEGPKHQLAPADLLAQAALTLRTEQSSLRDAFGLIARRRLRKLAHAADIALGWRTKEPAVLPAEL
jgi:hypothetical protein